MEEEECESDTSLGVRFMKEALRSHEERKMRSGGEEEN